MFDLPSVELDEMIQAEKKQVALEYHSEAWADGIAKARRNARRVDHYTEARYEDLVDDPEPVLREICVFVSLPYEKGMLSYHERANERMSELERDFERGEAAAIPAEVRARQHRRRQGRRRRRLPPLGGGEARARPE